MVRLISIETDKHFEYVGDGVCRSKCYDSEDLCRISFYNTVPPYVSNYDECKSVCENEPSCTGISITDGTFGCPHCCVVYGNVSSMNIANWTNPNIWNSRVETTYGFKGFEITTPNRASGARCYKRLDEKGVDSCKFPNLSRFCISILIKKILLVPAQYIFEIFLFVY